MLALGGWPFLMSEVPLYYPTKALSLTRLYEPSPRERLASRADGTRSLPLSFAHTLPRAPPLESALPCARQRSARDLQGLLEVKDT